MARPAVISLPEYPSTASDTQEIARSLPMEPLRRVVALLIEDDPDDAFLVESALKSAQLLGQFEYRTRRAVNMSAAQATLVSEAVDLVLLDLTLPDMTGLETVAAVRATAPDAALVVLTSRDDELLARAALRIGADDYLVKGQVDDRFLERAVRYSLERRGAISERMKDFAERDALREQLRHAQRMEALGRLAAGVAHDFNNVLTVILGHAAMLRADGAHASDRMDSVEQIELAGQRAARLTSQLLAFSRQQVAVPRSHNLNAGITETLKMLRHLLGEPIELVTDLMPALPDVRIDPGHFEQILVNLAVNARDAMPNGGLLSIRTSAFDVDDEFRRLRPYVRPGQYVVMSVNDTGRGMTEEVRARIFEPFFTTKGVGKGTGLGLSTVYGIVKQAGGYIWCTSVPLLGTRFDIYLPITDTVDAVETVTTVAPPVSGGEQILVVEDEKAVRMILVRALRKAGYQVLEAECGEQALEIARGLDKHSVRLVLTDMVMPGSGGREVAAEVARLQPDAKVVYMSGYTDDELVRCGSLPKHQLFLQKPFDGVELLRVIGAAMDGSAVPRPAV